MAFGFIAGYTRKLQRLRVLAETIARNRDGDTTIEVYVDDVPHIAYPVA